MDESKESCSSCHTPWTAHLGIQGTCAELQKLKVEAEHKDELIRFLRKENRELKDERAIRNKRRKSNPSG